MNVFDITAEHAALMAEIEELGGNITPEIAERLNINEENLATKVRAYYHIIKMTEGQIAVAEDEQARLKTVRDIKKNLITRLKKAVDLAVEEFGVVKHKAINKSLDLGDLKVWQKKTEALESEGIDDERFCKKLCTLTLTYEETKDLVEALKGTKYESKLSQTIVIDNAKLKDFVIENEDHLKELKKNIDPITKMKPAFIEGEESTALSTNKLSPDDYIALATNLKHNSTVVFK